MRLAVLSVHTSPLDQPGTGDGGGLNVYVVQVGRRLTASGVDVDVFTRAADATLPPVVELAAPGPGRFTVHHVVAGPLAPVGKAELPHHLWAFLRGVLGRVGDDADGRAYDVLHAHYWLSGWVGRCLRDRWGTPLVQSFHTLAEVKNAALSPGDVPEPPVRLLAEARLIAEADRIVVPVCGEARHLHRAHGASGARLTVVPPGVDLETFHPAAPQAAPVGEGPLLLFVGRLQPLKGPDVAIATLAEVRRTVPDARLLVVGGASGTRGTDHAVLRRLAADLGVADAVTLLAARPQHRLAELYRAADVVLVPSRSESFGLVALEAQACGTPVVAADVGGLSSVVGGGGTLVPGHDPAAHAAAVVGYLSDPDRARRAAEVGIQTARRSSWELTAERLVDIYRELTTRPLAMERTGA